MTDNVSSANRAEMDLPVPSRVRWRARLRRFFLLTTLSAATLLLATWIVAGRTIAPVPVEIGVPPALDVKGAIDYVKRREPTLPIAIVGRSMGAAAAVMAGPLGIDALILESMYSSIDRAVDNRVRHRIGILSSCVSPLLLLQFQP